MLQLSGRTRLNSQQHSSIDELRTQNKHQTENVSGLRGLQSTNRPTTEPVMKTEVNVGSTTDSLK
jgi:hypothetical protein